MHYVFPPVELCNDLQSYDDPNNDLNSVYHITQTCTYLFLGRISGSLG